MTRKPLRVTLIHNDAAGEAEHSRSELLDVLPSAGCRIAYFVAGSCDLAEIVALPADLIAVAGGDGTVAKVARHLRPNGCPLAVLPLGTANNIAKSLDIADRPLAEVAAGWPTAAVRPFFAIEASGPWGRERLIEGIGFGAFEQAIADLREKPGIERAREVLAQSVMSRPPQTVELQLDAETIAGSVAMLEVTTIALIGPNLRVAEAADPSDRQFEICLVGEAREDREALAKWLTAADRAGPAPVTLRRAEQATVIGQFRRVRLDGKLWPNKSDCAMGEPGRIALRTEPEPLLFLVPQ